jgi:hypothetical protein
VTTSGLDRMRNDAVLAFLHLDGRPADPDYRYAARQLGQPLLEFFAVTQLTLSLSSPSSGRAESKTGVLLRRLARPRLPARRL